MEQQVIPENPALMAPSLGEECGRRIDLSTLDAEQLEAYEAVLGGESVFITGGAGTGKTRTVRAIVQGLRQLYGEADFINRVAITGATGTAAVLLGGCTLHSATGLQVPEYVRDFQRIGRGVQKEIWGSMMQVLIIDEASMISGEFLDHMDAQLRTLRGEERAFGGLQVVLVGDVFQLPPITTQLRGLAINVTEDGRAWVPSPKGRSWKELFLNRGMLFQSDAFWDLQLRTVQLRRPHRQARDEELADLLGVLRKEPDEEAVTRLTMASYRKGSKPPKDCVHLLPTRAQVDEVNAERLAQLPGKATSLKARDEVEITASPPENATLDQEIAWEMKMRAVLRKSALLSEVPKELQLKPDALVMLARTTEHEGGLVNGATGLVRSISERGVQVRFQGRDFDDIVRPIRFKGVMPGIGKVVREQIPLRLAWAMTHHRCQGKTVPVVSVDPVSFERGQAYVALSRCRSLETLHLQKPPRVKDFLVSRCSKVFDRLTEEGKSAEEVRKAVGHWRDSWPANETLINFGRFRGRTFEELALLNRHYCRWTLNLTDPSGAVLLFQHYLRRFWPHLAEDKASED